MLFLKKPCPCCNSDHGHSRWAVSNCSVMKPLRCKHCLQNFHQTGVTTLLLSYFLVPTGIFFAFHWSIGLGAIAAELTLVSLYINRKKPLAAGPRYG